MIPEPTNRQTAFQLWRQAGGDRARYLELLEEHGLIVPNPPCTTCGERFRHRHDGEHVIALDIFGHDRGEALSAHNAVKIEVSHVCAAGWHSDCQPFACACECHR